MKLKVIITGATGMVGEGVLLECLENPEVEQILSISRKPSGIAYPKLTELLHKDFYDFSPIEGQLKGYNACFFCLGVSSIGKNEDEYRRVTYDLTMGMAEILSRLNPDMTFCYISGTGTDSSEKGRSMWARIKGKTENDLMKLPFKRVFAFRPAFMKPSKGMKHTHSSYTLSIIFYPILKVVAPKYVCKLSELGKAMINSALLGYDKQVLEVKDILELAEK